MTLHQVVYGSHSVPGTAVELIRDNLSTIWHGTLAPNQGASCSELFIASKTGIANPTRVWWEPATRVVWAYSDDTGVRMGTSPGDCSIEEQNRGYNLLANPTLEEVIEQIVVLDIEEDEEEHPWDCSCSDCIWADVEEEDEYEEPEDCDCDGCRET